MARARGVHERACRGGGRRARRATGQLNAGVSRAADLRHRQRAHDPRAGRGRSVDVAGGADHGFCRPLGRPDRRASPPSRLSLDSVPRERAHGNSGFETAPLICSHRLSIWLPTGSRRTVNRLIQGQSKIKLGVTRDALSRTFPGREFVLQNWQKGLDSDIGYRVEPGGTASGP